MPDHAQAREQLKSAQANLRAVSIVPEKEEFPVGSVLRWKYKTPSTHWHDQFQITVKASLDHWILGRHSNYLTWQQIVQMVTRPNLIGVEINDAWKDITVKPEVPIQIGVEEMTNSLVLFDPDRDLTWDLIGADWVRRSKG